VLPQWRPCVTGHVGSLRGGLQHPLHQAYSGRCCILLSRRSPLSGLACFLSGDLASQDMWVRKISRGGLQHPLRMASFGDIVVILPRRFPCLVLRASSVETLHHRTCGIRKISRRLQTLSPKDVDYYLFIYLFISSTKQIQSKNNFNSKHHPFFHPLFVAYS
jgi:hypothetical protein